MILLEFSFRIHPICPRYVLPSQSQAIIILRPRVLYCAAFFFRRQIKFKASAGLLRGSEGFMWCSAFSRKKSRHFSSLRSLLYILSLEPKFFCKSEAVTDFFFFFFCLSGHSDIRVLFLIPVSP